MLTRVKKKVYNFIKSKKTKYLFYIFNLHILGINTTITNLTLTNSLLYILYQYSFVIVSYLSFFLLSFFTNSRDFRKEIFIKLSIIKMFYWDLIAFFNTGESLLMIAYFSYYYNPTISGLLSTSYFPDEGLLFSVEYELTSINTQNLSSISIIISNLYILLGLLFYNPQITNTASTEKFTISQVLEFRNLSLYINDNTNSLQYLVLIYLHCFHYNLGINPHYMYYWNLLYNYSRYSQWSNSYYGISIQVLPQIKFYTLQLSYWHFVEIVWIFIDFMLYTG